MRGAALLNAWCARGAQRVSNYGIHGPVIPAIKRCSVLKLSYKPVCRALVRRPWTFSLSGPALRHREMYKKNVYTWTRCDRGSTYRHTYTLNIWHKWQELETGVPTCWKKSLECCKYVIDVTRRRYVLAYTHVFRSISFGEDVTACRLFVPLEICFQCRFIINFSSSVHRPSVLPRRLYSFKDLLI